MSVTTDIGEKIAGIDNFIFSILTGIFIPNLYLRR